MASEAALVEIQNISKQFASQLPLALKEIQASLAPGQIIGIVGPDGARTQAENDHHRGQRLSPHH